MSVQKVSFQNTQITKQNQQNNVGTNPVATNFTGDSVETSNKKKEHKGLKYTLIGIGAILGAIAIIKRKNIAEVFKKAPEIKSDINSKASENSNYLNINSEIIENIPLQIPKHREEGDSRLLFKNLTAEENKSLSSFLSKKQFTKNDYDSLSEIEKNTLRALVDKDFQKEPNKYFQMERPVRSIAKDLDFMIKVTDKVEESLKLKYPKGFTVVSLGGSPSLINDLLVARGYKTKSIPLSTAFFEKEEAKTFNFEKYLNKFSITKENSKNTNFVYLDYVQMGHTKEAFEKLMNVNGFYYKFENMDDLYKTLPQKDFDFMKDYFMQSSNIKAYTTCPKITEYNQHTKVEDVIKDYEWGNPAKLMRFAILDKFKTTTQLSP